MPVALGSDHAGFSLKQALRAWLDENSIEYIDYGCFAERSADYPDYSHRVAMAVSSGLCHRGVVVCGTGIGATITANKVSGIRAALCCSVYMAEMARQHNDANILGLGGRIIEADEAIKILAIFLETPFAAGRHRRRVEQIHRYTER